MEAKFEDLKGKTIVKIDVSEWSLTFVLKDGSKYRMFHESDCCEDVHIEDICGDLRDVIGPPVLMAEEVVYDGVNPEGVNIPDDQESFMWTFYKLGTVNGDITIRWYGESNGHYSESVDFELIEADEEEKDNGGEGE